MRFPKTRDMRIQVIRIRYIEFIISLSNLKGSLYITENSLEKYELRIFLLTFQFDYLLVF